MTVREALLDVQQRLTQACIDAGRDPSEVTLIAVSKTHPAAALIEAHAAGQLHFGESYAQELRDKARVTELTDVTWHYIGRLQTNKAKYIAPVASRVHALETLDQAEALVKRAPGPLKALMSVNIGRQDSKGGVLPEHALERARQLSAIEGLDLVGLMCLPPYTEDPEGAAPYFEELAHLAASGRADGLALHELSMGMTHDFHVAVRFGATWVRVGTAIFGTRGT